MNIPVSYIQLALKAAEEASEAILEIYNSGNWDVESKSDASPLTKADKAAHEIIEKYLSKTSLPILSEEGKNIPYKIRKEWGLFWLVDPLDGTKEFIKRNGEFTVNIALIKNGEPIWGVVMAPVLNKCYYVNENSEVCLKDSANLTILKRRANKVSFSTQGIRVVASRSHASEETTGFISSLVEPVLVNMGSSLKFMMLAEGKADVYPRFAPTMEWDTAAAHAILLNLGFELKHQVTNNSLIYNKPDLLNPGFIAG